jgi:ABC-type transport system involved in multi-copper enzyme maturation permease subunit
MSNPMIRTLIGKELSLNRKFMVAATAGGLVSLGVSVLGRIGWATGAIMFLTVLIAYGVILPMYAMGGERKERTRLFVLSLPVSRGEYVWTKVVGVTLCFLIPWAVLLVAALALILASPMPDGLAVFTSLVMMFALADFSIVTCASMLLVSEAAMAVVIIFTNMSVTFFMVGITSLTRVGRDMSVDAVNWSTPALATLGVEVAVMAAAFALLFWVTGREPDII